MTGVFYRLSRKLEERLPVPVVAAVAGLVFLASVPALLLQSPSHAVVARGSATSVPTTTSTLPAVATTEATPPVPARSPVAGFDQIGFTISPVGTVGSAAHRCGLLADTADQQAQGLKERYDLSGYDAMVFRFASDSSAAFYTSGVSVPLSIAWYGADGHFVSSVNMPLCTTDAHQCPRYRAATPYRYALEVLSGGLDALGAGAGSTLQVGGSCS